MHMHTYVNISCIAVANYKHVLLHNFCIICLNICSNIPPAGAYCELQEPLLMLESEVSSSTK